MSEIPGLRWLSPDEADAVPPDLLPAYDYPPAPGEKPYTPDQDLLAYIIAALTARKANH
jgi:hypothetical protein